MSSGTSGLCFEEGDGSGAVVQEVAEAAIVEVDHLRRVAVDQQVGQAHVAVHEVETIRRFAEALQPFPDALDGPREEILDLGGEAHAVAPGSPVRPGSQGGLEVPGEARESGRLLPVAHVTVHAGGDLAEDLEGAAQVVRVFVRFLSRLPAREHHVAWPGQIRVGDELDELAVTARDGDRRDHRAVAAERREPYELRGDAVAAVIVLAVDPQRPSLSRTRGFHPVGRVLGHVDEVGGDALRQVVALERRIGEASDCGQALLVRQVVELRHPFLPSFVQDHPLRRDDPPRRRRSARRRPGLRHAVRARLTGGRPDSTIPPRVLPPGRRRTQALGPSVRIAFSGVKISVRPGRLPAGVPADTAHE